MCLETMEVFVKLVCFRRSIMQLTTNFQLSFVTAIFYFHYNSRLVCLQIQSCIIQYSSTPVLLQAVVLRTILKSHFCIEDTTILGTYGSTI
jgi:hypothetical protein